MIWPHLKVFWLSTDDSAGHSARKKIKSRQKKGWVDNIKEWTGMDFASLIMISRTLTSQSTSCVGEYIFNKFPVFIYI